MKIYLKALFLLSCIFANAVGMSEYTAKTAKPKTAVSPNQALHDALGDRNLEAVEQAIKDGADVNALSYTTPIAKAIMTQNPAIVKTLLMARADPNLAYVTEGGEKKYTTNAISYL
jgi:hypothetical protein